MVVVEQATVLEAPVEAVIQALNEVESIPTWATVAGKVYNVQGRGLGMTFEWHYSVEGVDFRGKTEVVEQTTTTLISRTTGDVDSIWTVTLRPISQRSTAMQVVVEYNPRNRFVEVLADQIIQRYTTPEVAAENLRRFKEMVEARVRITEGV